MNTKKYVRLISITALILCVGFVFIFYLFLYPLKHKGTIIKYSNETHIPAYVIASVINTESSFNRKAVSDRGAVGLMQILPSTAEWVCDKIGEEYDYNKLFIADFNIKVGSHYLAYLINKFNNLSTAIVAYNAGEGTVGKWLKISEYSNNGVSLEIIPYKESKDYLNKVICALDVYMIRFY